MYAFMYESIDLAYTSTLANTGLRMLKGFNYILKGFNYAQVH
jgi:hypothetical protein